MVAGRCAPFARTHLPVARGDLAARGQDQSQRMIGHILVIDAGRVGDWQTPRAAPFDIDPVIARGETGQEVEIGKPLDQRLVQRRFAGHDHDADVVRGLDGRTFPEAIDVVGALQKAGERGEMPLHDENGGALGHARTSTR